VFAFRIVRRVVRDAIPLAERLQQIHTNRLCHPPSPSSRKGDVSASAPGHAVACSSVRRLPLSVTLSFAPIFAPRSQTRGPGGGPLPPEIFAFRDGAGGGSGSGE